MNYEDALEYKLTQKETKNYIRKHGLSFSDFTSDIGIKSVYTGQQVLDWLGY